MTQIIEPVPRAEVERLYPELKGRPLWGERACYTEKELSVLNYVVYGPIEPRALQDAYLFFKSVKVVSRD